MRKIKPWYYAATFAFLLLMFSSGCERESRDPDPAPVRTLLFYMGGDNNLSAEVHAKMEKIKAASLSPFCRVLVYADTKDAAPRLLELTTGKDGNTFAVAQEYEESNSADANVFEAVLCDVRERFPSPSYALVLFSHASGWMPEGTYNNSASRSVVVDNRSEMELQAMAEAIPGGMFDFIIFEACHMAGVEVAYELKDKTKYIVASSAELVSPGFSGCYAAALPYLYRQQADLEGFCRAVETDYSTRTGDYKSLTLSLIDIKGLENIATVLKGTGFPPADEGIQCFDRYGGRLFFDLGVCYCRAFPQKAEAIKSAMATCVIRKAATAYFMPSYGGFKINAHSGLTTYIPQADYPKLNEAWKQLKWYKEVL